MYPLVVLLVAINLPTVMDMTQTMLNTQITDIGIGQTMLMGTNQIMLTEIHQIMGTNQASLMDISPTFMGPSLLIPARNKHIVHKPRMTLS